MPWIKVSDDPPDYRNWLKCGTCGWLALLTQDRVYASEMSEPCKYCSTPLRPATAEDMKAAYQDGVYEWQPELSAVYVPVHLRQNGNFIQLPEGDKDVLVWIKTAPFAIIASWDPDTEEGIEIFHGDDHTIALADIIAWAPLDGLAQHVRESLSEGD